MTTAQQAVPKLDTPLVQDSIGETSDGHAVQVKGGNVSIPWYRFFISLWNRTGGGTGNFGVETGSMLIWPGDINALPSGLLPCNGLAVGREQYANLFGVIGVKFGAGDGSSTFNLPNVDDKVIIGESGSKPSGSVGGNDSIVLSEAQLPVISPIVDDPGHHHTQQVNANNTSGTAGSQGGNAGNNTSVGQTDDSPTGITVEPFGSGAPIDITPRYLALLWVIQS